MRAHLASPIACKLNAGSPADRRTLEAARLRLKTTWRHELEPGREQFAVACDDPRAIATGMIHLNHNAAIVRTVLNGGPTHQPVGVTLTILAI